MLAVFISRMKVHKYPLHINFDDKEIESNFS